MAKIPALTPAERETVILIDDESPIARISTHQRTILTKLERNPSATKVEDLSVGSNKGASFEIPKNLISFRTGRTKK